MFFERMIIWYFSNSYNLSYIDLKSNFIYFLNEIGEASYDPATLIVKLMKYFPKKFDRIRFQAIVKNLISVPGQHINIKVGDVVSVNTTPRGESVPTFRIEYMNEYFTLPVREVFEKLQIDWENVHMFNRTFPQLMENIKLPAGDFYLLQNRFWLQRSILRIYTK